MIEGMPAAKFGVGLAFERVQALAQAFGVTLSAFAASSLLIVGSNGKGTTAAMAAAALQTERARVGLFTSPHVMDITERIRANGVPIPKDALQALSVEAAARWRALEARFPNERMGAFEHLFVIAAVWFARQQCDAIVWEAGIGGRYDPTRLIRAKAGALVSLDLEHTALLGTTLELIGCDKLDGFASGATVYCGPSCQPIGRKLETFAALTNRQLRFPNAASHFSGLEAPFLSANATLAIAAAAALLDAPGLADDPKAIAAVSQTRMPARLETVRENPLTIVDIGHTPAAAAAAGAGFREVCPAGGRLLIGVSEGKDAGGIVAQLVPQFAHVACVRARHAGLEATAIADLAQKASPKASVRAHESVAQALADLTAQGEPILAAGSLYVAAEVKALVAGLDPAALWFF
jgi:dihydrofolate synthase/folylpolyglutamate synthase